MQSKCPGQDTRYWKPEDIYELECPSCHTKVEFFKTDVVVKCPKCKKPIKNKRMNLGCAEWCPAAETCTGLDKDTKKRMEEN